MKIRLVLVIILLTFSTAVFSSPQWLRYSNSDNARDIVGGNTNNVELAKEKPEGLVLPKLNSDDVRFAIWNHEMAGKKARQIILDRQKKYGKYDIMYFDSDGDGSISDSEKYQGKRSDEYRVNFYGIPVLFETEDGMVTYHLNFYYYSYRADYERLYVQNGCWYEGMVDFGGVKSKCVLVDYNLNGSFNDISDSFNSDRIIIGDSIIKYETQVGKYLEYDNKLYNLQIAKDGAFIEMTSAGDVAYSQLEIPVQVDSIVCCGINGLFKRENITNGKISLPVGRYKVKSWHTNAKDDSGTKWEMGATWYSNDNEFDIQENASAKLDIGKAVYSTLSVSQNNGTFYFNHQLSGNNGESVSMTKSGRQPDAPKIRIYNRDRTYDQTFSLEYG